MTVPVHIGFIMDGNGRWARQRGKNRIQGHQEGLKTAKMVVRKAREYGIQYVSLYAFSTENWRRAESEVSFLMGLIGKHLRREYDFYRKYGIRVVHSGDLSGLPAEVRKEIHDVAEDTRDFNGLTVNLLINYGGRDAVIRAVRRWQKAENGEDLTEESLRCYFDNPDIPDSDLIIRTAGEKRMSNFLLWEGAYAEYVFSEKLWPDFEETDFEAALKEYASRDRRFGGTK